VIRGQRRRGASRRLSGPAPRARSPPGRDAPRTRLLPGQPAGPFPAFAALPHCGRLGRNLGARRPARPRVARALAGAGVRDYDASCPRSA
jgi:hypothetical protein